MLRLYFIKPGLLTTIQDEGRFGHMFYGIPRSGYMDKRSAHLANLLVGNDDGAPLLEFTYQGGAMYFDSDCIVAFTGADMQWKLDQQVVERNQSIRINAGQHITGTYTRSGFRAYMSISGEMKFIKKDYNSYSTYHYAQLGGMDGRALVKNDVLTIETYENQATQLAITGLQCPLDSESVGLVKGPDAHMLDKESLNKLWEQSFHISPDSNRMGARLVSTPITPGRPSSKSASNPILPGTIQLLPSGQLVVILQDGQVTGGYPRIGYIPTDELDKFNQIRPGRSFVFKKEGM